MKEKLEAVTGGESRKNSIKSTTSKKSDGSAENTIGKLEEKKKLLMEQKLGAGMKKKIILLSIIRLKGNLSLMHINCSFISQKSLCTL